MFSEKYEKKYAELSIKDYNDKDFLHRVVKAAKKNAVVRQSLIRYFDQIEEWKTFTESIQQMERGWNMARKVFKKSSKKSLTKWKKKSFNCTNARPNVNNIRHWKK